MEPRLRYNPALSFHAPSPDAAVDTARLARLAQRDAAALSEFYDAHSRLMFGVICRIVHDRTEAEEVLQEAFVQAWTRAATYNPALGSPAGWLVGISALELAVRAIDEEQVLIAPGTSFGEQWASYVRVTFLQPEEQSAGIRL